VLRGFSGRHRHVADYLASEVLADLDIATRRFLLHSSVLPRLSAAVCDFVLQRDDSTMQLTRIVEADLLVIGLDDEGEWYRYHPLFADHLRKALTARHPEEAAGLHRRAAQWFDEHGYVHDALDQAAGGDDDALAADILAHHAQSLVLEGRAATIRSWTARLPSDVLLTKPDLLAWSGIAAGSESRPRPEIERLMALLERARELDPARWSHQAEATLLLLRAACGDDDVGAAIAAAEAAVAVSRAHGLALLFTGTAMLATLRLFEGDLQAADDTAAQLMRMPDAESRHFAYTAALSVRAVVAAERGRLTTARAFVDVGFDVLRAVGLLDSIVAARIEHANALIALREGKLATAEGAARRALKIRESDGPGAMRAVLLLTLCDVLAARGRVARAERTLEEAREVLAACPDPGRVPALAAETAARVQRARTRMAAASDAKPLSKAELAVLRHFPADLTAREIADELVLALTTVKAHIRAIYRKLGVHTRDEAVARVDELGLLDETPKTPDEPA
jgi:LuxR family transcriptional regulator, maltose regulon positive regulatory protein